MKASTTTGVMLLLLACSVACAKPQIAGFSDFLANHVPVTPPPPIISSNNRGTTTPAPPIQPARPVTTSTTSSGFPAPPIFGSITQPSVTVLPSPVFMDIRIDTDMALPFVLSDPNGIFVEFFDAQTNNQLNQLKYPAPTAADRFGKRMQRFTNPDDLVRISRAVNPNITKIGIRVACATHYELMSALRTVNNFGYISKNRNIYYAPNTVPRASWANLLKNMQTALLNGCRKSYPDSFLATKGV